jgi:uncharacterized protein (DUF488 family)
MSSLDTLYTIGHSNHSAEHFVELLQRHSIEVLADVRSQPFSRYTPHFNRESLAAILLRHKIRYWFIGDQLGGRPSGNQFYDDAGHVLYHRLAEADFFVQGIDRLLHGIKSHRAAMMCSEEDPLICHRHRLVARILHERGVTIQHIRDDGRIETYEQIEPAEQQRMLFGELEVDEWKSLRSVLPKSAPESFSGD